MISWRHSWIENGHDPGFETGTFQAQVPTFSSLSTDPEGGNVQGQEQVRDEACTTLELVSIVPISEKKN